MEKGLRTYPQQKKDLEILITKINGENLTLVEIGSYMGESMEIFAQSGKFSKIVCIDPWTNGYDDSDASSSDCQDAEEHFDKRKLNFDFVEKIKDKNENVVNLFQDESIDIVYVDGNHIPEEVKKDIKNWLPKIKNGGYISGHDWYYKNGEIQQAVLSVIGMPDFICGHGLVGTDGDGSWLKVKSNINN